MSVYPDGQGRKILRHLETWFWPLRVLGACPVYFPNVSFPILRLLHTLLVCCVLIGLTYLCNADYCLYSTESGIKVSHVIQCGTLLLFYLSFFVRRRTLEELLGEFARAESALRRLGVRVSYSRPPLAHAALSILIMLICESLRYNESNLQANGSYSKAIVSIVREDLFFTSLVVVNYGISTFMHSVVDLLQVTISNLRHTLASMNTKNINHALIDLALIHDGICNLCEIFNDFFSIQLLFFLASTFVSLVLNTYFAFNGSLDVMIQCRSILFGVVCFIKVDILAKLAIQLKSLAMDFNSELYQIMIEDASGQTTNNEKLLLHISMKREVDLSVCGFFHLDNTLLHSMVTAAASYLLILVQFGSPSEPTSSATMPSTEITTTTLATTISI